MSKAQSKPGPYYGLDVGDKRIGVARADARARIAMPVETVQAGRGARPAEHIARLVTGDHCPIIVVGWPLTLEGEEGRAVQKVQRFVDRLLAAIDQVQNDDDATVDPPEIIRWDERMTTTAAESFLIGQNVSRSRRKKVVDQIAATHILQGYLDSLR